jgi:formylglycine-generating enzyme required for sulfatase activity
MPVLIDFGSARQRLSERSMTVIESAGYTPFEQLQSRGNVGPWSDLYALAATLVKVMTGEAPPKANDRVMDDPWRPLRGRIELAGGYSKVFLECLDRALKVRVEDRWQSADDWLRTLSGRDAKVPANDVPSPPLQSPAPRSLVPVVDSVTEMPPSPEFEQSTGSRKRENRAITVVLLCGVLLPFAMMALMPNDGADRGAANVLEEAANVEEPSQDPSSTDTRDSEPVREETSVTQPGEERDFEIAPGVKMTMCWIPPGEFMMGSPEGETGRQDDEVQHRVRITKGFWLGKYEVTHAQWRAVMGKNPSDSEEEDLPVEKVSWNDIASSDGFIERVNQAAAAGGGFSLPREAQWEYAARAGATTALNSGKELTSIEGPCRNLDEVGWYDQNSGKRTHGVGQKKPNGWGLHDMHGNVWELCQDWYGPYESGLGVDPQGTVAGSYRVIRGGSWGFDAGNCRVACRDGYYPTSTSYNIGFRVARSSVP